MTASLGVVQGYLATTLKATTVSDGNCTHALSWRPDGLGCGCRVAECQAGRLIADALQEYGEGDVGLVNSGAIRATLSAGELCV